MKTAFDKPCVKHTKVKVILHEDEIIGRIVTGISNNFSGATTTLEIEEGKMPFQKRKISISKTMAGGGMNFAEETKNMCLLKLIEITDNEEFFNDKLKKEGETIISIFKTYFKITFETII
jgi:hypothetical protein